MKNLTKKYPVVTTLILICLVFAIFISYISYMKRGIALMAELKSSTRISVRLFALNAQKWRIV